MTVSFLKYFPWQAMNFLQCSTHFLKMCCKLQEDSGTGATAMRFIFHIHFPISKVLPPLENHSSSHCIISIGLMDEL